MYSDFYSFQQPYGICSISEKITRNTQHKCPIFYVNSIILQIWATESENQTYNINQQTISQFEQLK